MAHGYVAPSYALNAFSCPHCGAFTSQTWSECTVERKKEASGLWTKDALEALGAKAKQTDDVNAAMVLQHVERAVTGDVFYGEQSTNAYGPTLYNLALSQCYACKRISVWVYNNLIYPPQKTGPEANPDLPPEVLGDYEEAQSILALSPRGAAALLRLGIQKLCGHLKESGKDLNADIANLVKKGLSPTVQKALDIVRVIGNEAVHPGTIDLRDNRDTALQLFRLVNLIAEQMISNQKHVDDMYLMLPPEKRAQIEKRDKK